MSKNPLEWDEIYLLTLIGQAENYHLEFKAIDLLVDTNTGKAKDNDHIGKVLSKEVSAFANAEGGTIVVGLAETKATPSSVGIASALDGAEESIMDVERLQRIVESSLSPHVAGMRFRRIPLAGTTPVRCAYIIIVHQGTNAYQAKDRVYYGRSEFECKPLHDTMIRLLMNRGRTMQGTIGLQYPQARIAEKLYQMQIDSIPSQVRNSYQNNNSPAIKNQIERQIAEQQAKVVKEKYDEYTFSLQLKNVGELTITECYLTIEILFKEQNTPPGQPVAHAYKHIGTDKPGFSKENFIFSSKEKAFKARNSSTFVPEEKVYPGISIRFPEAGFGVRIPAGKTLEEFESKLKWTLYYDNFPSNSGEIKLSEEFK